MTYLVADCVGKSFGMRQVLASATLRAVRGEVCALLGRNGIGKSTLAKIAVGWHLADTGYVRVDGETLLRPRLPELAARGVFYLPDHDILSNALTLRAQLGLFQQRFGGRSLDEAAQSAAVDHLLDRRPGAFSGGELRRAEVALALVRRPKCLIADEPYRGIAPVDHDILTRLFRVLAAEGCAVVVTGHEVPALLAAADRVTWCVAGTTRELGTPSQARADYHFCREYLGTAPQRAPRPPA